MTRLERFGVQSRLQFLRQTSGILEVGHPEHERLGKIRGVDGNNPENTQEVRYGSCCLRSARRRRYEIVRCGNSVSRNVAGERLLLGCIEKPSGVRYPWAPIEKNVENDVDVHEDLHLRYFFSRYLW